MRTRSFSFPVAFLLVVANPCGLRAEPLFDAPYRWFPCAAAVHAVAGSPRIGRTGAFAVVSHTDEQSVEILAASANGDLSSSASIAVPTHPHGVAIADFNGDGCPDVAVGGHDPPGVVVIHGRCGGKFSTPVFIPLATSVEGLEVVDIDADGRPDLVGWSSEGGVVLLADAGDGFRAPVALPGSYGGPIGRIDADPYPDIVRFTTSASGYDSLTVQYGRGDGTFGGERSIAVGGVTPRLTDLNGDGHLDVVYALADGVWGSTTYTLINDGNGNLSAPSACTGGSPAGGYKNFFADLVVGGDMDGDHVQDLIQFSTYGGPQLTLALGNGCGRFRDLFRLEVQSEGPATFADMDGDGRDELLLADGAGVSLFTGSATGRYGRPALGLGWQTGAGPMVAAHLDDGPALELAVPDNQLGCYDVVFGMGGNVALAGVGPGSIAAADLDLDGHPDVVTSSWPVASITNVALGDGHGGFTSQQDLSIGGIVGVVRAGGDAHPEVLVLEPDSLIVLRNRGDTVFERARAWAGGGNQLVVCDLNGDGRDDVVIRNGSLLSVRFGGSAGLDAEAVPVASLIGGKIAIVDVDGDGRLDVFDAFGGAPEWRRGRGDGTFDAPMKASLPSAPDYALADWNGDGMLDAAWLNRKVGVAFGLGGGAFSPPTWFGTGYWPSQVVAGDFDGDGRPDLAVLGNSESDGDMYGQIDLMLNQIPPGAPLGVGGPPTPRSTVFALGAPSPNPLRDETRFRFAPGRAQPVSVRVLDIAGREVRMLLKGAANAGEQEIAWDGRDARGLQVPPGVYLVNASGGSASITRRVVVLR